MHAGRAATKHRSIGSPVEVSSLAVHLVCEDVHVRDLIRVLREQRLAGALVTLVCGLGAAAVTLTQSKVYRAQSSISFGDVTAAANLVSEAPIAPSPSTLVNAA